jgi:hypothetical protein
MLFTTTLLIVRNQRILAAWNARQEQNARRAAKGSPPENPAPPPHHHRRPHRHSTAPAVIRLPATPPDVNISDGHSTATTASARPEDTANHKQ